MAAKQAKTTFVHTVEDFETGEIKRVEQTVRRPPEPPYVKVYIETLCAFTGLSKSLNPILIEMLRHMSWADGSNPEGSQIIYLNSMLKKRIAANAGVGEKRIEQALKDFVAKKIFRRVGRGTYQVNPKFFGKGNWDDIYDITAKLIFGPSGVDWVADVRTNEDVKQEPAPAQEAGSEYIADNAADQVGWDEAIAAAEAG